LQSPTRRAGQSPLRSPVKMSDVRLPSSVSFPGLSGPLYNLDEPVENPAWDLLNDLPFHTLLRYAYMFNFMDDPTILSINKKVKIRLQGSEWSRPIGLNSVGVNQTLSIEHATLGMLEVSFKVGLAPGRLSKYTKVIRFLPRFTFVNRLPYAVKIMQADGFNDDDHREKHEKVISSNHAKPYHLPSLFGERKIFVKVEGPWNKTVPIDVDHIGSFSLDLQRHFDLASTPHVNTRGAPEYSVVLPPNITIGLSFETDWGEENIVVKSLQAGHFAAQETDIKVGDVLIAIDHIPLARKVSDQKMPFEEMMELLKTLLTKGSVVITLRTVEEKLKLIRESAISSISSSNNGGFNIVIGGIGGDERHVTERRRSGTFFSPQRLFSPQSLAHHSNSAFNGNIRSQQFVGLDRLPIRVEFRPIDSSMMVMISPLSEQDNVEFRIENKSVSFYIHYKQKGLVGNSWASIPPGETRPFIWEDPFKPHKLLIHVGDNLLSPSDYRNGKSIRDGVEFGEKGKGDQDLSYLSYLSGVVSETAIVINMDEIGSIEYLPVRSKDTRLIASIRSEGPTKILHIAPRTEDKDILEEMKFCYQFFDKQIFELERLQSIIQACNVEYGAESSYISNNGNDAKLGLAGMTPSVRHIQNEAAACLQDLQIKQKELLGRSPVNMDIDQNNNSQSLLPTSPTNSNTGQLPDLSAGIVNNNLVSYEPIERLFDGGIDTLNQVEIEVFEAKELPGLVAGKLEDTYCKLYIRSEKMNVIE
jgi:hypothetical protein